jgi:hypothetical protein
MIGQKTYSSRFFVLAMIMNTPNIKNTIPVYRFNLPDDGLLRKLSTSKMNETIKKNNPITKFSSFNLLIIEADLKENDI